MSSAKPIGDNRTTNGAASAATSPPAYLHKKFKRAASTVVDDHLDNEFEQSNSATTSAAAAGVASDNQVIVHPGSSGSMAVDGSPITTYKPRFHRAALHQSNSNKYNTNTPNDHHHHNLESAGVSTSQKRRLSANLGRQRDDNIENRFSPNKLHQALTPALELKRSNETMDNATPTTSRGSNHYDHTVHNFTISVKPYSALKQESTLGMWQTMPDHSSELASQPLDLSTGSNNVSQKRSNPDNSRDMEFQPLSDLGNSSYSNSSYNNSNNTAAAPFYEYRHPRNRPNSFNMYSPEEYSSNTLSKPVCSTTRQHSTPPTVAKTPAFHVAGYHSKQLPTSIVAPITKQFIDLPLPSPGPLLGKTPLIDYYNADANKPKLSLHAKSNVDNAIPLQQSRFQDQQLRKHAEPATKHADHLKMCGGEVKIVEKKDDSVLRFPSSGGSIVPISSSSEAEPIHVGIRSGLMCGGAIIEPIAPKRSSDDQLPHNSGKLNEHKGSETPFIGSPFYSIQPSKTINIPPLASSPLTTAAAAAAATVAAAAAATVAAESSSPSTTTTTSTPAKATITTSTATTKDENAKTVASKYLEMAIERNSASLSTATLDENSSSSERDVDNNKSMRQISSGTAAAVGDVAMYAQTVVVGKDGFQRKPATNTNELQVFPLGRAGSDTPRVKGSFIQDDGGPCKCEQCGQSFQKQHQLTLHMNIHYMNPGGKFRCETCSTTYNTRGLLQKHLRSEVHNNSMSEKPRAYECTCCEKAFRNQGHLAKHFRSGMHVQRLEYLQKLPSGTYNMVKEGRLLDNIDTTDCDTVLASLTTLAEQLKPDSDASDKRKSSMAGDSHHSSDDATNSSDQALHDSDRMKLTENDTDDAVDASEPKKPKLEDDSSAGGESELQ